MALFVHQLMGGGEGKPWEEESYTFNWARIFKLVRSAKIDSKESILPAYVAWRTGTTTLFLLCSWPP